VRRLRGAQVAGSREGAERRGANGGAGVRRLRLALATALPLLLAAPAAAQAKEAKFKPIDEFIVKPWFHFSIGPVDLGISKAVVYIWLAALISILLVLWIVRGGLRERPGRLQTIVETIYGFAESNIGQATLPHTAFKRWFPYVASLFVFIWTMNMISFIPLPVSFSERWHGIPQFTIYAATSNLSVTLALTLVTITITHVEGIRANGAGKYFASWVPATGMTGLGGALLKGFLIPLEILSQLLRVISLSVRLFANMLAGHLLIIMCLGFSILLGNVFIAGIGVPVAVAFYLFEFGLVASLQAYIFAMLSGIYIGGAMEPHH
jgi:F-type H+-transporting ATPase subunit a